MSTEEEKAIRARIRAEMEEEKRLRKEMRERDSIIGGGPETAISETKREPIKLESQLGGGNNSAIRIQIKFPDGTAMRDVFKPEDRLSHLLDKITERKIEVSSGSKLIVPFPHKVIELIEDSNKTLFDLGLCPSASLVFEP